MSDSHPEVRVAVLRFIQYALKMERDSLPLLFEALNSLLNDDHPAVVNITMANLVQIIELYKPPLYSKEQYHISVKEMLLNILNIVQR